MSGQSSSTPIPSHDELRNKSAKDLKELCKNWKVRPAKSNKAEMIRALDDKRKSLEAQRSQDQTDSAVDESALPYTPEVKF